MPYPEIMIDEKVEVSPPDETEETPTLIQSRTLQAVNERLRNFISRAIVHRELRKEDPKGLSSPADDLEDLLDHLEPFCKKLTAAADKLANGDLNLLPTNPLNPDLPDLQFTDYTKPLAAISAHK